MRAYFKSVLCLFTLLIVSLPCLADDSKSQYSKLVSLTRKSALRSLSLNKPANPLNNFHLYAAAAPTLVDSTRLKVLSELQIQQADVAAINQVLRLDRTIESSCLERGTTYRSHFWLTDAKTLESQVKIASHDFVSLKDFSKGKACADCTYLHLKWFKALNHASTSVENFFPTSSWSEHFPPGKISMVHASGEFKIFENSAVRAVMLPSADTESPLAVLLIMPKNGSDSVKRVVSEIGSWSDSYWANWLKSFRKSETDLVFPTIDKRFESTDGQLSNSVSNIKRHSSARYQISSSLDVSHVTLNEQKFEYSVISGYLLCKPGDVYVAPVSPAADGQDRSNNPPGVVYFEYHDKPGMIFDRPFLILVLHKKSGAVINATLAP